MLLTLSTSGRGTSIASSLNCRVDRSALPKILWSKMRSTWIQIGVQLPCSQGKRATMGLNDGTRVSPGRSCKRSQVWLHRLSLHQESWSLSASCYIKALYAVTNTQLPFSHWTWYEISIASPADQGHWEGAKRQSYTYGLLREASWEM